MKKTVCPPYTKEMHNARRKPKRVKKKIEEAAPPAEVKTVIRRSEPQEVPMSKDRLFDNQEKWLDDEPWRTW